jgi:hypothetical protein
VLERSGELWDLQQVTESTELAEMRICRLEIGKKEEGFYHVWLNFLSVSECVLRDAALEFNGPLGFAWRGVSQEICRACRMMPHGVKEMDSMAPSEVFEVKDCEFVELPVSKIGQVGHLKHKRGRTLRYSNSHTAYTHAAL